MFKDLYVGVAFDPNKEGSVGVAHGDSIATTKGLNDFVDIDGDSLPDKVFVQDKKFYYRPNQAAKGIKGFQNGSAIHISSLDDITSFMMVSFGWEVG